MLKFTGKAFVKAMRRKRRRYKKYMNYIEPNSNIPTMGSLFDFDGIGGFPCVWRGKTAWTSEIDEFCIAVVDYHARRNEL